MAPSEFPRNRLAATLALALPALVLALALWVLADPVPPFQALDDAWLRLMDGPHEGPLWLLAETFNRLGGSWGPLVPLLIALALVARRRWRSALFAVAAVMATSLVTNGLKLIGDRARPDEVMVSVASNAFPSGHVSWMASVVVVVTVVAIPPAARRWWWPIAALLVLAMMWSRTWLYAHWLTDTLGGAATGIGVSMLCWWAFDPLLAAERRALRSGTDP